MNSSRKSSSGKSSSGKSSSGKSLRTDKSISRKTKHKRHRNKKTPKHKESNRQGGSGNFTEKEIKELNKKLEEIGFDDDSEINAYVHQLGSAAHIFSGDNFKQLLAQLDAFRNQRDGTVEHDGTVEFNKWLKTIYSNIK